MPHDPAMTFRTTDGQTIRVRQMLPADVNLLVDIFHNLSEDSIYQRFREPTAQLSPLRVLEEARALAQAGYSQGKGFLAFADLPGRRGAPVAGIRYIRTGDDVAEVAITVRDDFQQKGIGTQLLGILIDEARQDGIHHLVAHVSANNRAALKLLRRYPFPQRRTYDGSEMTIQFDISEKTLIPPDAPLRTAREPNRKPRSRPGHSARTAASVPWDKK